MTQMDISAKYRKEPGIQNPLMDCFEMQPALSNLASSNIPQFLKYLNLYYELTLIFHHDFFQLIFYKIINIMT